jgi:hypothetical protein
MTITPTTLDEIAQSLQSAIRAASGATEAFTRARVLRLTGIPRAIIVPGVPRRVRIEESQAADLLAFSPSAANELSILVGAQAGDLSTLTSPPRMVVVVDRVENEELTTQTFNITLSSIPATLADCANDLQTILRARPELSAADTFVRSDENHLVVYSLEPGVTLRFLPHIADPNAVTLLGLTSSLPAISYDAAGIVPAPETTIEESTIMGAVSVRAMTMGSNSIFTETVFCQRRQIGCMRFSYVPPASITPVRYHCEPDHAAEVAADKALKQGLTSAAVEQARASAERRVQPEFTTRRFGLPAYAQLSLDCADEIRAGADNGAEMGVFNVLMQPQREANLRIRFEEYLPFGLEAGLIFVD